MNTLLSLDQVEAIREALELQKRSLNNAPDYRKTWDHHQNLAVATETALEILTSARQVWVSDDHAIIL